MPGRSRQLSLFVGSVQQQKGHEGGREGEAFIPRSVPARVVSLWAAVEGVPGVQQVQIEGTSWPFLIYRLHEFESPLR